MWQNPFLLLGANVVPLQLCLTSQQLLPLLIPKARYRALSVNKSMLLLQQMEVRWENDHPKWAKKTALKLKKLPCLFSLLIKLINLDTHHSNRSPCLTSNHSWTCWKIITTVPNRVISKTSPSCRTRESLTLRYLLRGLNMWSQPVATLFSRNLQHLSIWALIIVKKKEGRRRMIYRGVSITS